MEISELLQGRVIKIRENTYLSTIDYVAPFIEKYPEITWIGVKETASDTFPRVTLFANAGNIDESFKHIVGFSYSLDGRVPMAKFYTAICDNENRLYLSWKRSSFEQRITPGTQIDMSLLDRLQKTDERILDKLTNTTFKNNSDEDIDLFLGRAIRMANTEEYPSKISKIKYATSDALAAYKLLFVNNDSKYYLPTNLKTVYDAFTHSIINNSKDVVNRYEKSWLVGRFLSIW